MVLVASIRSCTPTLRLIPPIQSSDQMAPLTSSGGSVAMMPHHRYSPRALGGLLGRCGMWHALCLAPSRRQGPTAGRGPAPPARGFAVAPTPVLPWGRDAAAPRPALPRAGLCAGPSHPAQAVQATPSRAVSLGARGVDSARPGASMAAGACGGATDG